MLKQPSINTKEDFLSFYGENEEIQSEKLGKLIETSFLNQFPETLKQNKYMTTICASKENVMTFVQMKKETCLKIISFNING